MWRIAVVVALGACTEHGSRPPDGGGPIGDAANACDPSGGCPNGPACGELCCNAGEQCVNGICQCGAQKGCTMGNFCTSGIPSPDRCGSICCGATMPCPALQ